MLLAGSMTLEYYRGSSRPGSNEVTHVKLHKHTSECFPRFSSFIFLCDMLKGTLAVILALFDFAKRVEFGSSRPDVMVSVR